MNILMSSSLFFIIVDITKFIEKETLEMLKFTSFFSFRYINDMALAILSDLINYISDIFSSF